MDPNNRNFPHGERLIRTDPGKADALGGKWLNFVKNNPRYPELQEIDNLPELFRWMQEHQGINIDNVDPEELAGGFDVTKTYFDLAEKARSTETMPFSSLLLLPILATAFRKSLIMGEDHEYQRLLNVQKETWLKEGEGRSFESKEGLDYLYGSLENPDAQTIHKEIEGQFRKEAQSNPKMAKRLARYEKERVRIYKNLNDDPAIIKAKELIEEHFNARLKLAEKENQTVDKDTLRVQVEERAWRDFAERHIEKARSYAGSDEKIKTGFDVLPEDLKNSPRKNTSQEKTPEEDEEKKKEPSASDAWQLRKVVEQIQKEQGPESFSEPNFEPPQQEIPQEMPNMPEQEASPSQPRSFGRAGNALRNQTRSLANLGSNVGQGISRGASQLATKAAPLLANPYTLIVLGVILAILIIVFLIIIIIGGGAPGEQGAIPGLSFNLEGPTKVNNGEQILYKIVNGTYIGTEDITFKDIIPPNTTFANATGKFTKQETDGNVTMVVWKLNDNVASTDELGQKTFWFSITLTPNSEDIVVENKIVAETSGSGGGGGGGSGNECTARYEGSGFCSVENLKSFFGDSTNALTASLICQSESGSNPTEVNNNCSTNDYSVGLFQINLVAHCPGAYGSGKFGSQSCDNLLDLGKRNACEVQYKDPEENIKKAVAVFQGGGWGRWGTWRTPNKGNPSVEDLLKQCNIIQ